MERRSIAFCTLGHGAEGREDISGISASLGRKSTYMCKLPSAKDLGYHSRQQRQRWEICGAAPDIGLD
jgi:hypothetical protein